MQDDYIIEPADVFEKNPNILKAELDFAATPRTLEFTNEAYSRINDIQTQCSADYKAKCASQSDIIVDLDSLFFRENIFFRRALLGEIQTVGEPSIRPHHQMLNAVSQAYTLYSPAFGSNHKAMKPLAEAAQNSHVAKLRGGLTEENLSRHGSMRIQDRSLFGWFHPGHDGEGSAGAGGSSSGSDSGSDSGSSEGEGDRKPAGEHGDRDHDHKIVRPSIGMVRSPFSATANLPPQGPSPPSKTDAASAISLVYEVPQTPPSGPAGPAGAGPVDGDHGHEHGHDHGDHGDHGHDDRRGPPPPPPPADSIATTNYISARDASISVMSSGFSASQALNGDSRSSPPSPPARPTDDHHSHGDHHDGDHGHDHGDHGPPQQGSGSGPPSQPRGPPSSTSPGYGGDHRGPGDGNGNRDHDYDQGTPVMHTYEYPRHEGQEDTMYGGSLGFGAPGDSCLYSQFESLAPPCQEAVRDLFALRQDYWESDATASGHGCNVLVPLLLLTGVAVFGAVRRHQRRKKVIAVLDVLHANPELKAAVEAKGVVVPVVPPCMRPSTASCCSRLLRLVLTLVITFLVFVALSLTSIIITANIIMAFVTVDEQTGEVAAPTPSTALFVFLGVLVAETLIITGIARFFHRRRATRAASASTSSTPAPALAITGTACSNNTCSGQATSSQPQPPCRLLTFFQNYFGTTTSGSSSSSNGYLPLACDASEHGTASTGMLIHAQQQQPRSTEMVFVQQQQQYVQPHVYMHTSSASAPPMGYVPVTVQVSANPVSAINMI